jgi:hypothetical protein
MVLNGLVSHLAGKVWVGGVDRFDVCIELSCRLLTRKYIGRTIERSSIPNGG